MKEYSIDDLVRVAKRENNNKRPYLYVNPLQGKHVPVSPKQTDEMCDVLAEKISDKIENDTVLAVGFAETATGISALVSEKIENVKYYQTTTREQRSGHEYLDFSESHSHATQQKLDISNFEDVLRKVETILFIEDEVTTGNTICKLIDLLREKYDCSPKKFVIASLLNSMQENREKELAAEGIACIYIAKIPYEYKLSSINSAVLDEDSLVEKIVPITVPFSKNVIIRGTDFRITVKKEDYIAEVQDFSNRILSESLFESGDKVLVVGTEEFMYPTLVVGKNIEEKCGSEVRIHSTTRSPILVSKEEEYPLKIRYGLKSFYDDERKTFIYNISTYDKVIILTDAMTERNAGLEELISVLNYAGNNDIKVYEWRYVR